MGKKILQIKLENFLIERNAFEQFLEDAASVGLSIEDLVEDALSRGRLESALYYMFDGKDRKLYKKYSDENYGRHKPLGYDFYKMYDEISDVDSNCEYPKSQWANMWED